MRMENFINKENLENSIGRINVYRNSRQLQFEKIMDILETLNYAFDTENSKRFFTLQEELVNKGKTLNAICDNQVFVLNKAIERYAETAQKVANLFKDIKER